MTITCDIAAVSGSILCDFACRTCNITCFRVYYMWAHWENVSTWCHLFQSLKACDTIVSVLFPCSFTWLRVYPNEVTCFRVYYIHVTPLSRVYHVTSPESQYPRDVTFYESISIRHQLSRVYLYVFSPDWEATFEWRHHFKFYLHMGLFACDFTSLRVYIYVTSPVSESISTSSSLSPCPPFMSQSATYDEPRVHNVERLDW
jgi:hypothetical protein